MYTKDLASLLNLLSVSEQSGVLHIEPPAGEQVGEPWHALIQLVRIGFVLIIFFIAPAFAPSNQTLSLVVFIVTINGGSVIWNFAMIGLFLCGIILFTRYAQQLRGKWIVPPPILYGGAATGIVCSLIAIYSTLFAGSPIPQLLSNADWIYWMLLVVFSSLAVGAAYSFLVPEAEDLVALTTAKGKPQAGTRRSVPAPVPAVAMQEPLPPANQPSSISGSVSSVGSSRPFPKERPPRVAGFSGIPEVKDGSLHPATAQNMPFQPTSSTGTYGIRGGTQGRN
ncbi:MAG: hypothetical protein NVS4B11_24920 [Ktedonobacteraceae bacterium]